MHMSDILRIRHDTGMGKPMIMCHGGHANGGPRLGDVVDCYQAVIPCDYHTRDYSTD